MAETYDAEIALAAQAEFNALITDVSRSFLSASPENIDRRIDRALGRIGRFSGVDRAYVFFFEDGQRMTNTHEWCEDGVASRTDAFQNVRFEARPKLTNRLMSGHDVHIPNAELACHLTEAECAFLEAEGIASMLAVPMLSGGKAVGFLGFDSLKEPKDWPADTISLMRVVADIIATSRERMDTQLELRTRSRAIEQSPVAVIITDATGAIEYVNPKFSELTGYSLDEVMGKNPRLLKSGLTPPETYKDMWETVLGGHEWHGTLVNRKKSGEPFWASVTVSAMRNSEGEIVDFVGVQEDVTKQMEEAKELVEARVEAESANKAKSAFLATMSHEIRTPMNAIIGMAELLRDTELSVQQARYVDIFERAGEALLELINDILDLSKIEADRLDLENEAFDVRELIEAVGSVMSMRASEKDIELLTRVAPDVPTVVVGDQARLRQVITNLLGNAVKFTEHGQVLLIVGHEQHEPSHGGLRFTVSDTGIGISAEKLPKIFESFTQADSSTTRKYGGTGLGLTISKRIVELMGGTMEVDSVEGEGTTFSFFVPLGTACDLAESCKSDPALLAGRRILVVDDNETNRLIVSEMVSSWGVETTEADCARAGLDLMAQAVKAGEPFDVLILDHQMPEMDGFDMLERVRFDAVTAGTPAVMLTSDPRGSDRERAAQLGLADYLLKPVRRSDLLEALSIALAQAMSVSAPTPVVTRAPEREAGVAPSVEVAPMHILLVEDTDDNRFLIRNYLAKTPHTLLEAVNGEEAVEAVRTAAEPFDLVLMDMQMPVMDGYEATRRIRAWESETGRERLTIVALTAYALTEEIERSLQAGCDGHLTKPIKKKTLLQALSTYSKEVGTDA